MAQPIIYEPVKGRITKQARINLYRIFKEQHIFSSFGFMSMAIEFLNGNKPILKKETIGKEPTFKMKKYLNFLIFYGNISVQQYKDIYNRYMNNIKNKELKQV